MRIYACRFCPDLVLMSDLGHEQAWTKAKVLHRDISSGNILIVVDQTMEASPIAGILCDWDLCKFRVDLKKPHTQHGRSVRILSVVV